MSTLKSESAILGKSQINIHSGHGLHCINMTHMQSKGRSFTKKKKKGTGNLPVRASLSLCQDLRVSINRLRYFEEEPTSQLGVALHAHDVLEVDAGARAGDGNYL